MAALAAAVRAGGLLLFSRARAGRVITITLDDDDATIFGMCARTLSAFLFRCGGNEAVVSPQRCFTRSLLLLFFSSMYVIETP